MAPDGLFWLNLYVTSQNIFADEISQIYHMFLELTLMMKEFLFHECPLDGLDSDKHNKAAFCCLVWIWAIWRRPMKVLDRERSTISEKLSDPVYFWAAAVFLLSGLRHIVFLSLYRALPVDLKAQSFTFLRHFFLPKSSVATSKKQSYNMFVSFPKVQRNS